MKSGIFVPRGIVIAALAAESWLVVGVIALALACTASWLGLGV